MFRRKIAAVAVAVATGFGLTVAAGTASADTVTQTCYVNGSDIGRTVNVTITVPATVTRGVPVPVFLRVRDVEAWTGRPLGAGAIMGIGVIKMGGAGSGEFKANRLGNPTAIAVGEHWYVEGTEQVAFTTPGTITLGLRMFGQPIYYGCLIPTGQEPPVAATVTVA
ncbi:hypothetical protein [Amycolatopsis lurida]|uniref:hypothetical protein n=1 Tax=Amycolatopsis lurida TaxID=31959 RepID=UPI003656A041